MLGKKVDQYHEEDGKRVSVINLGMFDQDKHVEWVKANPAKAPKRPVEMRKQVRHLEAIIQNFKDYMERG